MSVSSLIQVFLIITSIYSHIQIRDCMNIISVVGEEVREEGGLSDLFFGRAGQGFFTFFLNPD